MRFNHILIKLKTFKNIIKAISKLIFKMTNIFTITSFSYPNFIYDKILYTDYAFDILNTLFQEEQKYQVKFNLTQEHLREYVIHVIEWFARTRHYSNATIHLATLYMDIHMNRYLLSENVQHLRLTTLVATMLAAKSNEIVDNIPPIKDFISHGFVDLQEEIGVNFMKKEEYTQEQLKVAYKKYAKLYANIEFIIFESLQFSLTRPTTITFLEIFSKIAVTEDDMNNLEKKHREKFDSFESLNQQVNKHIRVLSMIVLYHIEFHQYDPSKNAAAIIATSRFLVGIKKLWNIELEFLTRASIDDIKPIIEIFVDNIHLMKEYLEKINTFDDEEFNEDSGFHSDGVLGTEEETSL
ncbi:hypothetical protein PVAND_010274 [Polypedilum vanderplanki]|uniref:Cyclin C-terminal domain-containing protein n=1 Tax=Polypedilum vanderplanki TaxID=319348 RepID=A0A9J6CFE4_POLVA|nr:hypothetical protein PVAND_010274 [Polypedilum vanderplanki]